ncbi:hypothetical protein UCDDS831_g04237 [Diplodia seriata]|uniref:Uncharacterized protein n=1 Tax=Diplodia seriata TaxID=420778 RepID=A0A0G2EGN9_9PEZI|nr:hypothetical protein UCDDS831_g04237 [Diplodia seriata]
MQNGGAVVRTLHSIKVSRRSRPVSPRPNNDNLKFTEKKFRVCKKTDDGKIGVDCGGQAEAWMYNGRVIPTHVRKWSPKKFNKLLMGMDKAEEVSKRLTEKLRCAASVDGRTCKLDIEADAEGLIRYFDPSDLPVKETNGTSKFAAQAGRPTDDSAFKGMKVVKKEEEGYFAGSGSGKKGKLNRRYRTQLYI